MNDEDLQDLFAGLAMQGLLANGDYLPEEIPRRAYKLAASMLEAKYAHKEEPEVGIAAVVKRTRKKNVENT
jgi:hypothetical protein